MRAPTAAAPHARILGVGGYRPSRVVTNDEICSYIDSSDLWIRTRSGIETRRWASPEETVQAMASAAAAKALANSGVRPEQLGCVLLGTVSHLHQTPALAPAVTHEIGAGTTAALDINAGCAAFCYGIEMAQSMIRGGSVTGDQPYVLVIGVERLSDITDVHDRSTAFLFGDGAGAVVVGPSDEPAIGPTVWGSDGGRIDMITQRHPWDAAVASGERPALAMQGNSVFRWASYEVAKIAAQAMDEAGVSSEELAAFIPHQANMRITDAMAKALQLPGSVAIARDIAGQGNTSAASIPLAMERLIETGEVGAGGPALLVGFGAGLAYAAQVVQLP